MLILLDNTDVDIKIPPFQASAPAAPSYYSLLSQLQTPSITLHYRHQGTKENIICYHSWARFLYSLISFDKTYRFVFVRTRFTPTHQYDTLVLEHRIEAHIQSRNRAACFTNVVVLAL